MMDPANYRTILHKLTSVEYMRSVMLKYLLESLLVTFAYYWVIHKKNFVSQRKVPSIQNVTKLFVYVILMFTTMDILAPQVIGMVRAGIALSIGTHMGGGILLVKD